MTKIRRIADIVEFQVSSAGMTTLDPQGSGANITDPNRLENFDSAVRNLTSYITSAQDKIHLIGETVKTFNKSLTDLNKSFIVTSDTAHHTLGAITSHGSEIYSGSNAGGLYETTLNVHGQRAKEVLRSRVADVGGRVTFAHDKATVQFPISDAVYKQYLNEHANYVKGVSNPLARFSPEARVVQELFGDTAKENLKESLYQKAVERQRDIKREALERQREADKLEKYNASRLDSETYAGERLKEKLGGDSALSGLTQQEINQQIKAYDKDVAKKKEDEKERKRIEAEQKKENKERHDSIRSLRNAVFTVIGITTVIANIARRLLTAVLDLGRERREAGLEARALGLSPSTLIEAGYVEKARGLKSGTIAGALGALQQKFGDPRALDESALRELAPYIPQAIAPAVRSGLYGGANSEKLLELIVNNAVDRIGKGLNWAGEQVGEKEARRNIISSLERVSPDLAKIANNVYDTNRFGVYAGQAGSYSAWTGIGFGKQNPLTLANSENITQMYDMVTSRFEAGWEGFKTSVLSKLSGILEWLEQSDIGLSDEEKATKRMKDYSLALGVEQSIQQEGRTRIGLFSDMLKGKYGIDFASGDYSIGGKSVGSIRDLMSLSPNSLKDLLVKYSDLGEAFQNSDILQQYVNIMVLNKQAVQLKKELDKVRKDGQLSGFKFNKLEYSAENRAMIAGDTTGELSSEYLWGITTNMGNKVSGFNAYTDIPGLFAPLAGSGQSYSDVVNYMVTEGGKYGIDWGYGTVSPTASLDALEYAYNEELRLGKGKGTDAIEGILRSLYDGKIDPRKVNYKNLFGILRARMKNGAFDNARVNALVTSNYASADRWNYLQGEWANKLPQNMIDLGAGAVAHQRTLQAEQESLITGALLSDPIVASAIASARQNNTLSGIKATAQDEYTIQVTLNQSFEDGRKETKNYTVKSPSSGVKGGQSVEYVYELNGMR